MSAPSASSAPVPAPTTGDQSPSAFLAQPRQELEDLLNRKALVDDQIANIERQIYYLEGSYLEETATQGNVLRGFDGYLTARAAGVDKKKGRFKETERLFSLSSSTYQKSLQVQEEGQEEYTSTTAIFPPQTPNDEDEEHRKRRRLDEDGSVRKGRPRVREPGEHGE